MKISVISDTHEEWDELIIPECDILISCGDFSFHGEDRIVREFHSWLDNQPATHIISVMGNHETRVEKNFALARLVAQDACARVHFMEEGLVDIDGFKIWCSAWTPTFHNWAYNASRGEEIKRHWSIIPDDIDILITHGPPAGILDVTYSHGVPNGRAGCFDLWERIQSLRWLKLHCFGHIHESSGEVDINGIRFINASICNDHYRAVNPVRTFEL